MVGVRGADSGLGRVFRGALRHRGGGAHGGEKKNTPSPRQRGVLSVPAPFFSLLLFPPSRPRLAKGGKGKELIKKAKAHPHPDKRQKETEPKSQNKSSGRTRSDEGRISPAASAAAGVLRPTRAASLGARASKGEENLASLDTRGGVVGRAEYNPSTPKHSHAGRAPGPEGLGVVGTPARSTTAANSLGPSRSLAGGIIDRHCRDQQQQQQQKQQQHEW